LQVIDRLGL